MEGYRMTARRVGYALCLAADPTDVDQQRRLLVASGCTTVHVDQGYTAPRGAPRPRLGTAIDECQPGVLVVTSLARLASRYRDVAGVVELLVAADVPLEVDGTVHHWTSGPGLGLVRGLSLLLDHESAAKRLRSLEGRAASAKARDASSGRLRALDDQAVKDLQLLRDNGADIARLAELFNVSEATVRRYSHAPRASGS
jgi:DNA invertase Pin-like site-specific DNA recombinase